MDLSNATSSANTKAAFDSSGQHRMERGASEAPVEPSQAFGNAAFDGLRKRSGEKARLADRTKRRRSNRNDPPAALLSSFQVNPTSDQMPSIASVMKSGVLPPPPDWWVRPSRGGSSSIGSTDNKSFFHAPSEFVSAAEVETAWAKVRAEARAENSESSKAGLFLPVPFRHSGLRNPGQEPSREAREEIRFLSAMGMGPEAVAVEMGMGRIEGADRVRRVLDTPECADEPKTFADQIEALAMSGWSETDISDVLNLTVQDVGVVIKDRIGEMLKSGLSEEWIIERISGNHHFSVARVIAEHKNRTQEGDFDTSSDVNPER